MKSKKGISLIVLVITIIVMIVLAGAIILSLNNSGIIGKANQAVKDTDEATVKELAQMAWAEAYASGVREVEGDTGLEARVKNTLINNGLNINEYGIVVTTKGVTIKKGWLKNSFEVVKGNQVLEIGDTVNYNAGVSGYTGGWQVLGADDNGNLLIMSTADVKTLHKFGYNSTDTEAASKMEECQNDWLNGVAELDSICEVYGKGTGAIGARSIRVEDVNVVTGYDPKTASNGNPYGSGELYEYGNKVTYSYNEIEGATAPIYSATNGKKGTLTDAHTSGMFYYNDKSIDDLATGERGKSFVTLTSNYYSYTAPESTTENAKALELVFGEYDEDNGKYLNYYWVASPCVHTYTSYASFGMRSVDCGSVGIGGLFRSYRGASYLTKGVRAVVTLSSDIQFAGSSQSGWSY